MITIGIIEEQLSPQSLFNWGLASGGVVNTVGDYKIHLFTDSSQFIVSKALIDASVLILGQGGKGGSAASQPGGGGAAGIVRTISGLSLPVGTYDVSFGSFPGGTVSFYSQSATGGGNGTNGASTPGNGGNNADYSGSLAYTYGGGGAGAGGNGLSKTPPNGGPGITSFITCSSSEYGKGGNGGSTIWASGQDGPKGVVIIQYKFR